MNISQGEIQVVDGRTVVKRMTGLIGTVIDNLSTSGVVAHPKSDGTYDPMDIAPIGATHISGAIIKSDGISEYYMPAADDGGPYLAAIGRSYLIDLPMYDTPINKITIQPLCKVIDTVKTGNVTATWKDGEIETPAVAESPSYISPILVVSDTTIKLMAVDGDTVGDIVSGVYEITNTCDIPTATATVDGNDDVLLELSCATDGAAIYYALDKEGDEPTYSIYDSPITVLNADIGSAIINAMAMKDGLSGSAVASFNIAAMHAMFNASKCNEPVVSESEPDENGAITITMTADEGCEILYTTGGGKYVPNIAYTTPIVVTKTTSFRCIATKADTKDSDVVVTDITIAGTIKDPTFNPPPGTYAEAVTVEVEDEHGADRVLYTTNGTDPVVGVEEVIADPEIDYISIEVLDRNYMYSSITGTPVTGLLNMIGRKFVLTAEKRIAEVIIERIFEPEDNPSTIESDAYHARVAQEITRKLSYFFGEGYCVAEYNTDTKCYRIRMMKAGNIAMSISSTTMEDLSYFGLVSQTYVAGSDAIESPVIRSLSGTAAQYENIPVTIEHPNIIKISGTVVDSLDNDIDAEALAASLENNTLLLGEKSFITYDIVVYQ